MKITENLKSLRELMSLLENLDDTTFLSDNWIDEEEIELLKVDLKEKMIQYYDQVKDYIEFKLQEKQEHDIMIYWIEDKIKTLSDRISYHKKSSEKIVNWIDYLMTVCKIDSLETPLAKLSYTSTKNMIVEDSWVSLLPSFLQSYSLDSAINDEIKDKLEKNWLNIKVSRWDLREIKKWFTSLSEDEKQPIQWKIYIKENRNLKIK